MTQKEFEDRTKLSVTAYEFDAIDDMYMGTAHFNITVTGNKFEGV